jgi:hypothetical protein
MADEFNDIVRLRSKVFDKLHEWPGYETYSRVTQAFPSLEVYLAGGVVRNAVLGQDIHCKDFDLFFGGDHVDAALHVWAEDGNMKLGPYGCPRWMPRLNSGPYCDLIPIRRFTPGLWPCEDIVDVLNQFDITGNAMAFCLRSGRFFNPQNGLRDMERRILRCVRFDYPDEPFAPGQSLSRLGVLWFRMLHYASTLNLRIEPITLDWLTERVHFLSAKGAFAALFFEPEIDCSILNGL